MIKFKRYLVEQYLKENKITKTKFCEKIGINVETLNRFLKDGSSTNMVSAISICNGIGMRFPDFVEPATPSRKKRKGFSKQEKPKSSLKTTK